MVWAWPRSGRLLKKKKKEKVPTNFDGANDVAELMVTWKFMTTVVQVFQKLTGSTPSQRRLPKTRFDFTRFAGTIFAQGFVTQAYRTSHQKGTGFISTERDQSFQGRYSKVGSLNFRMASFLMMRSLEQARVKFSRPIKEDHAGWHILISIRTSQGYRGR